MSENIFQELDPIVQAALISTLTKGATPWPNGEIDALLSRHGLDAVLEAVAMLVNTYARNLYGENGEKEIQETINHLIDEVEVPEDFDEARLVLAAVANGRRPAVNLVRFNGQISVISALMYIIPHL